jgi:hypothetical protein
MRLGFFSAALLSCFCLATVRGASIHFLGFDREAYKGANFETSAGIIAAATSGKVLSSDGFTVAGEASSQFSTLGIFASTAAGGMELFPRDEADAGPNGKSVFGMSGDGSVIVGTSYAGGRKQAFVARAGAVQKMDYPRARLKAGQWT